MIKSINYENEWTLPVEGRGLGFRYCLSPKNLNLDALIEANTPSGRDHWREPCYRKAGERVVHEICTAYAEGDVLRNTFVNISSQRLKSICGKDRQRKWLYTEVLAMLVHLGVVEINSRYSTGGAGFGKSFSKSYRLGKAYRRGLSYKITVQQNRRGLWGRKLVGGACDPVHEFYADNVARVRVDFELLEKAVVSPGVSESRRAKILNAANSIQRGNVALSEGRTQKRVYHSINKAPRELRGALVLDGERLVELDVKTCQPVLLLSICPLEEKEELRKVLKRDFYGICNSKRDRAKKQFLVAAFGKYRRKNPMGEAIRERFPMLWKAVREYSGSLSAYLQNLEAEICVHAVGNRLREQGIFAVSIHDGYLARSGDAEVIKQVIREEFAKRLSGFEVVVSTK